MSEEKRERDRAHARASYARDLDASREKSRLKVQKIRDERVPLINAIKLAAGCVDCGYKTHPAALHFDHVDPSTKSFAISKGLTRSWATIQAEIAKCVVRCANCHVIRSVQDGHLGRPRIVA